MKKILLALFGLAAVAAIGAVVVFAVAGDESNPLNGAASDAKAAATNAAIDASGLKDKVKDALNGRVDDIAAATGLSSSQVESAIDDLAIDDWKAVALPSEAVATGTFDGAAIGVDGTITTYEDPGYMTVKAYGQDVTLEVPASAQQYLSLLGAAL